MSCDKKILKEMKSLFFSNWFSKPENRYVSRYYIKLFNEQRSEIDGDSQKRFFYGKYFTDSCIQEFLFEEKDGRIMLNKKLVKMFEAEENFDE